MAFSYGSIVDTNRTKERPEDAIKFLSFLHEKNQNGFVAFADKGFSGKEWNQKLVSLSNMDSSCYFFGKDSYVSVNTFKSKDSRTISNCQTINGIFLDLDIHNNSKENLTQEEIVMESEKVLALLSEKTEQGVLPKANVVAFTGRGLALYYLYEESLNADDELIISHHKDLYNQAMDYLQVLFAKHQMLIKMDRSVRDAARYCRIPGTKNTAAGEYSCLVYTCSNRYTLDNLHFTKVDCNAIPLSSKQSVPRKKTTKERQVSAKEIQKTTSTKQKSCTDTSGVILTGKPVFAPAWAVNMSARRMEQIEALMQRRGGYDGDYREIALFIYYNCSKVVHPEEQSVELAKQLNDAFKDPLPDTVFVSCLNGTNFHKESGVWAEVKRCHSDGIYTFKNETIAQLLALSEEESDAIGFFKRQNEKKRAEENKKTKALKKEAAILMRKNGASYKEISAQTGVCRDTLTRWFKPLGLVNERKTDTQNSVKITQKKDVHNVDSEMSDFSVNKKEKKEESSVSKENCSLEGKNAVPLQENAFLAYIQQILAENAVSTKNNNNPIGFIPYPLIRGSTVFQINSG